MSSPRVAIVTGANKGIGLAIVRHLALQYPSSAFNNGPLLIYLTARNKERGETAVQSLQSDHELEKAKALSGHGGLTDVKYHALDIGQTNSIRQFSDFLKKEHPDGIDVVVNNAGIGMDGFDSNVVKETLQCNYYGTLEATQTLLPHIRAGGRLVNIASMTGHLFKYSESLQKQFLASKTVSEVTSLMESFKQAVADGSHSGKGWPSGAYAVSKTGVIGLTRAVALEEEANGGKRLINSCCPGYIPTDLTKGRGYDTVDRGAQTPVLLALGDIGETTGEFWQYEKMKEW